MRPVQISATAVDTAGNPVVINKYQDAKLHLQNQIGIYCVFCERRIPSSLAVEHKLPKDLPDYGHLELEWTNFVLGCANCNSTKGTTDTGIDTYYFPDNINTAYAFCYQPDNRIVPNPDLSAADDGEQEAARRTLSMVGLDREENQPHTRWTQRGQVWRKAQRYRQKVAQADTQESWEDVVCIAEEAGFWSVWMAVFHDHTEVKKLLINSFDSFPGTRARCFDANGDVIADLTL